MSRGNGLPMTWPGFRGVSHTRQVVYIDGRKVRDTLSVDPLHAYTLPGAARVMFFPEPSGGLGNAGMAAPAAGMSGVDVEPTPAPVPTPPPAAPSSRSTSTPRAAAAAGSPRPRRSRSSRQESDDSAAPGIPITRRLAEAGISTVFGSVAGPSRGTDAAPSRKRRRTKSSAAPADSGVPEEMSRELLLMLSQVSTDQIGRYVRRRLQAERDSTADSSDD